VVVHACNPSTWEAVVGVQPGLYSKTLSQKERDREETERDQESWWKNQLFPFPLVLPGMAALRGPFPSIWDASVLSNQLADGNLPVSAFSTVHAQWTIV
jgi:hypothetical protein